MDCNASPDVAFGLRVQASNGLRQRRKIPKLIKVKPPPRGSGPRNRKRKMTTVPEDGNDANSPGPEVIVEDATSYLDSVVDRKGPGVAFRDEPSTPSKVSFATSNGSSEAPLRSNPGNSLNVPGAPLAPASPGFRLKSVDNIKQGDVGKRRGHKYKHSSVSHFTFVEEPKRAPLAVTVALDIPTWRELISSSTAPQRGRVLWAFAHLALAGTVIAFTKGSMAMAALSRLIFFDACSAIVCAVVDVLSNFEAWGKSSLRYPFGLRRAEVLAGLSCSIILIFMAVELTQHSIEHLLDHHHKPIATHEEDEGASLSAKGVDLICILVIGFTLISAIFVKNHSRIGRIMRIGALDGLHPILSNPSHALTLTCSMAILITGIFDINNVKLVDSILAWTMIFTIGTLGFRHCRTLGIILMMGQPDKKPVSNLAQNLIVVDGVQELLEIKCWQVDYELGCCAVRVIANKGEDADNLRIKLNRVAKPILETTSGHVTKWETTIEVIAGK